MSIIWISGYKVSVKTVIFIPVNMPYFITIIRLYKEMLRYKLVCICLNFLTNTTKRKMCIACLMHTEIPMEIIYQSSIIRYPVIFCTINQYKYFIIGN